ncbi:MAG: hypothetical protein WCF18_24805, partial [Chthoniobacteraceae bacterium]
MNPQRYRFVVRSAEEAVVLLREKLGANARVISVRQVEGKGLARFLSAPKLEVTAEATTESDSPKPAAEPAPTTDAAPAPVSRVAIASETETENAVAEPRFGESLLVRLIRAAGISTTVLARLQGHETWRAIERLPSGRALAQVATLLSAELRKSP